MTGGSFLAFTSDLSLASRYSCGTADALTPPCGTAYVSSERVYALAVVGVSATAVGFYIEARVDRAREASFLLP